MPLLQQIKAQFINASIYFESICLCLVLLLAWIEGVYFVSGCTFIISIEQSVQSTSLRAFSLRIVDNCSLDFVTNYDDKHTKWITGQNKSACDIVVFIV